MRNRHAKQSVIKTPYYLACAISVGNYIKTKNQINVKLCGSPKKSEEEEKEKRSNTRPEIAVNFRMRAKLKTFSSLIDDFFSLFFFRSSYYNTAQNGSMVSGCGY